MNTPLEIYFCGREQCAAGHSFGPAVRPHYLIHFILSGQGRYHVNGDIHHLQAGDAFLIYPGETTFYEADEKNPWEYAWIGFGGESCRALLSSCAFSENAISFAKLLLRNTKKTLVPKSQTASRTPLPASKK